ncbi:MAG: WYL domain-containing protein [Oscillospiraceae bacterium]|nr:WYL domain-containing protein [Oscillospiraceae bacterium]
MLFNEIYGKYFAAVSEIIKAAQSGKLTEKELYAIVRDNAFAESSLVIPQMLKDENWPLLRKDLSTPIEHAPERSLTLLEKRWLKSLLSDPRIKLFDVSAKGLEDIEPLYPADSFVYFDRYSNGDSFEDPEYIKNFKTVLKAMREHRKVYVEFKGHRGTDQKRNCVVYNLEYSSKDDKFRIIASGDRYSFIINMARITKCELMEEYSPEEFRPKAPIKKEIVFELFDERNALERVMLHFSHLEKETEKIGDKKYRVKLLYETEDETEMLIRILSFGPMIKVLSPQNLIEQIKNRIEKQEKLRTQK